MMLLVVVAGLIPCAALAQTDASSALVDSYEGARNQHDIEGALSLFTDDAVVRDRSGHEHVGKDQIRQYLLLTSLRGRSVPTDVHQVGTNQVAWTERLTTQVSNLEFGVEAQLQDGKIKALIYDGGPNSGRLEPLTDTSGSLPALVGMAAVALVLSAGVAGVSVGLPLPRRGLTASSLQGRLVPALQTWTTSRRRPIA
ncbi:MAG: nuclear transport factor 2 family protein [Chloroflexi bacterium]|nr:nuclear transport factor 2 family protein [Chloroflexota bacterium]